MTLRFGTDGVRGVAGTEMTPELVMALGRVTALRLITPALVGSGLSTPGPVGSGPVGSGPVGARPVGSGPVGARLVASGTRAFVVGRDTRRSGPLLAAALSAGLAAEGVDVIDVGVLPTPGVAALCADRGLAGAVISASHNPFEDNGVKLFGVGGRKLSDAAEAAIEADLRSAVGDASTVLGGLAAPPPAAGELRRDPLRPAGLELGVIRAELDSVGWYRHRLGTLIGGRRLDGIRVAVDCANGAAWAVASDALTDAGAEVVAILGTEPDGANINAGCGSTDPAGLAAVVRARRADVGLALDGDADRVIAVDGDGQVVDGDRLLALFAADLRAQGRLAGDTVVVTVMTNLGFHRAMAAAGIAVHETQVGDRYVLEALDAHGWSLGGEQSGHVIFRDLATTGDGLLSGLLLLDLVARSSRPLAELAGQSMVRFPQVLLNVSVVDRDGLAGARAVWEAVRAAEVALGDDGRVLLRPSGTEKLVRVMVEAPTETEAAAVATHLAEAVSAALGTP